MNTSAIDILIKSCTNCDSNLFIEYLMKSSVKVSFINKMRFYKYFKFILEDAKQIKSDDELTLNIEESYEINLKGGKNYCFYDSKKKAPLIVIEIKETNNLLYVDIHPF